MKPIKRQVEVEVTPTNEEVIKALQDLTPLDMIGVIRQFAVTITDDDLMKICKFMNGAKEWDDCAYDLSILSDRMSAISRGIRKWPPIAVRSMVLVKVGKLPEGYTPEAIAARKPPGTYEGKIISYHDSHGLCYEVEFNDETVSCYDPCEIEKIQ